MNTKKIIQLNAFINRAYECASFLDFLRLAIMGLVILQDTSESQIISDYRFKFTKREADIIDGLIQGKNNVQLASGLSLSENTIKTHIKSIYSKTGVNNRTELTYILMLNK